MVEVTQKKRVFILNKNKNRHILAEPGSGYIPQKPLPIITGPKKPPLSARKKKIMEVLSFLEKQYPQVFNQLNPRPLKVGIHLDVLREGIFKSQGISSLLVREALSLYTKRSRYRHAIERYKDRIDLKGQVVSRVELAFSNEEG